MLTESGALWLHHAKDPKKPLDSTATSRMYMAPRIVVILWSCHGPDIHPCPLVYPEIKSSSRGTLQTRSPGLWPLLNKEGRRAGQLDQRLRVRALRSAVILAVFLQRPVEASGERIRPDSVDICRFLWRYP